MFIDRNLFSIYGINFIQIYGIRFRNTGTMIVTKKLLVYIKSIFTGLESSEKINSNSVKEQHHRIPLKMNAL